MSQLSKAEWLKQLRFEAQKNKQNAEWLLRFCTEAEKEDSLTLEQVQERISKGRFW